MVKVTDWDGPNSSRQSEDMVSVAFRRVFFCSAVFWHHLVMPNVLAFCGSFEVMAPTAYRLVCMADLGSLVE